MTGRGQKQHSDGGDVTPDSDSLTGLEAEQMGETPGRGARQVPGAEPSDSFVYEHIEGGDTGGSKKPTETNPD